MELTYLLVEGEGPEHDKTPSSPTPELRDLLLPTHGQSTYMGGARPKVPNKPSAGQPQSRSQSRHREEPDPINYPHRWIASEMSWLGTHHPSWWKEMRACRRIFKGVTTTDNDYQVWYSVSWQVVAFRLSVTQQEASGWWDAPTWIGGLYPQAFMLDTDAPSIKGHEMGEDLGPGLGTTGLCCGIMGPHKNFVQCHTGPPEMHGSPYDTQQGWHHQGLPPEAYQRRLWNLSHPRRGCNSSGQTNRTTADPRCRMCQVDHCS